MERVLIQSSSFADSLPGTIDIARLEERSDERQEHEPFHPAAWIIRTLPIGAGRQPLLEFLRFASFERLDDHRRQGDSSLAGIGFGTLTDHQLAVDTVYSVVDCEYRGLAV